MAYPQIYLDFHRNNLSENSVKSDWVEAELKMARKKEKEEARDVLCPVCLDESWKSKVESSVLWGQLEKKYVIDFSGWKTKKFGPQFEKLLNGIKKYYEIRGDATIGTDINLPLS